MPFLLTIKMSLDTVSKDKSAKRVCWIGANLGNLSKSWVFVFNLISEPILKVYVPVCKYFSRFSVE